MRKLARISALILVAAGLAVGGGARGLNFDVTNTNDAGPGSLRQAITDANNANAPIVDTITITATGTVSLASALPAIAETVTINGPGADKLTVFRNFAANGRIFNISAGDVTIRGLTVSNGVDGDGGGIKAPAAATLTLERVALVGNRSIVGASSAGGGVQTSGTLVLRQSTVSGNIANGSGGGVDAATATIENSTISGNTAASFAGTKGGGLNVGVTAAITSSTFANNSIVTAPNVGRNFNNNGAAATIKNSLFQGGGGNGCSGTITSSGFNLADDATCNLIAATDQPSTNAQLQPLTNNGGPTATHAILQTSPAVDKGQSDALTVDQRGLTRPVDIAAVTNAAGGNGADIGAFELQLPTPPSPSPSPTPTAVPTPTPTPPGPCDLVAGVKILGTSGNDTIVGTSGNDVIVAGAGDDVVKGKGGNDTVCGGPGNDTLKGNKGSDTLNGEAGTDTCKGGKGNDPTPTACEA